MNDTTTSTADPTLIDTFANKVRAQPAVVMWYQNWERIGKRDFNTLTDKGTGMMDEVASRGAMPLVTWTPQDPALGTNQPEYALRAINAGDHDEYIAHWARDARAWGKPFYLRYAHERNGKWQPWSTGVNGNTAAQYVTAWRHAHDIFRRDRRHERALAGRTLAPVALASAIAYADRTPRGEAPFDPPGVTRLDRLLASGRPGVR